MKKVIYLCALIIMVCASKTEAQSSITSESWFESVDTGGGPCSNPEIRIFTSSYAPGMSMLTYFGDGTFSSTSVVDSGTYGFVSVTHDYTFPGTYTIKLILFNGTVPLDSIIYKTEYFYCSMFIIKSFYDIVGTGVYDSAADKLFDFPCQIEVSKNGIIQDTVSSVSGLYYGVTGAVNDVYSFRVVSYPVGLGLVCPAGGVIYDTIRSIEDEYTTKYFGYKCMGTATSFDLAVNDISGANARHQSADIYVSSQPCYPAATVTLYFSPKFTYTGDAYPPPAFASGNEIIWNLSGLAYQYSPIHLSYDLHYAVAPLAYGDTVHESVEVTPITGDINPANNVEIIVDTVSAAFDPNEMSVSPSGIITAGTQLQYTVGFENTGNDTAYNISVYDTLSDNVDVKSLNIIMASAVMNIAVLQYWAASGPLLAHNIVKFDFPNINLLDSSHHGQCDGAVIFTVNSLSSLTPGTTILNHAGIFFDYNPVVMTDTIVNIIGAPPGGVSILGNSSKTEVYPNPANEELTVKMDNGAFNTLNITNIVGQAVMMQNITNAQTTINIQSLPAGLYILTLKGDSGVKVLKFEKL